MNVVDIDFPFFNNFTFEKNMESVERCLTAQLAALVVEINSYCFVVEIDNIEKSFGFEFK